MKITTGTIARLATPCVSGTIVTDAEPDAPPLPFSRFDCDVPFETLRIGQRVTFGFGVGRTTDKPCARHVRPLAAKDSPAASCR